MLLIFYGLQEQVLTVLRFLSRWLTLPNLGGMFRRSQTRPADDRALMGVDEVPGVCQETEDKVLSLVSGYVVVLASTR